MKTKIIIFGLLLVLVIVLLWLLRQHEPVQPVPSTSKTNIVQVVRPKSPTNSSVATSPNERIPTPEEFAATREERQKKREAAIEHSYDAWRTPIEFYGRTVDENGSAVQKVQVGFSVNDLSQEGTSNYHTESDGNGFFSLKDVKGKLLVVSISKEGYYTSKQDNDSFEYGDSHVTAYGKEKLIVFHLRKKGEGADLIKAVFPPFAHIAQLKHDGTPVELDLLNGTTGTGQLKLEYQRDLSEKNPKLFNWKLQLAMSGGGFIGTDEEFPFAAPENGYQPQLVFDMPTNNPDWQGIVKTNYYFQLPDGKYGRMSFEFLPWNGVYTINSLINPTGSRNLEPQ